MIFFKVVKFDNPFAAYAKKYKNKYNKKIAEEIWIS